jgi:uncharacterized protein YcbK (DUF882 family)
MTEHFNLKEFECRDGSETPPDIITNLQELAENLEIIRAEIGYPIEIVSGYRSPSHNKKVGGAKDSQHLTGKAADIIARDKSPYDLFAIISKLQMEGRIKLGGLHLYSGYVHFDIRGHYARW